VIATRRLQVPRVNVDIPEALKARVDRLRAVQRRSLRAVVELALERYLATEEPKAEHDDRAA
jgi:predicted transcriptional regulator